MTPRFQKSVHAWARVLCVRLVLYNDVTTQGQSGHSKQCGYVCLCACGQEPNVTRWSLTEQSVKTFTRDTWRGQKEVKGRDEVGPKVHNCVGWRWLQPTQFGLLLHRVSPRLLRFSQTALATSSSRYIILTFEIWTIICFTFPVQPCQTYKQPSEGQHPTTRSDHSEPFGTKAC